MFKRACFCMQLKCIPANDKLVSIGLPLKSSVAPFLRASAYITDSFRLDSERRWVPCYSCVGSKRSSKWAAAGITALT